MMRLFERHKKETKVVEEKKNLYAYKFFVNSTIDWKPVKTFKVFAENETIAYNLAIEELNFCDYIVKWEKV